MRPVGEHPAYIDARLYNHLLVDKYPRQALVYDLYPIEGIRFAEIDWFMFGRDDDNAKLIPAIMQLVRLAIPRRGYAQIHVNYIVGLLEEFPANKDNPRVIRISKDPELLRNLRFILRRNSSL
jgi:tryptophanase